MLGILNGTTAFMTMVVAYFWLKESISLKQMFGIILGFLGILVLVNPANGSATLGASGFALVGALSYSFSGVYIQKYQLNANKFVLIGWAMLFGGLLLTPLSFFNSSRSNTRQQCYCCFNVAWHRINRNRLPWLH